MVGPLHRKIRGEVIWVEKLQTENRNGPLRGVYPLGYDSIGVLEQVCRGESKEGGKSGKREFLGWGEEEKKTMPVVGGPQMGETEGEVMWDVDRPNTPQAVRTIKKEGGIYTALSLEEKKTEGFYR